MKYLFHFSIFGKEMKAEIIAPNETEAREILLRKVKERVSVISATPVRPSIKKTEAKDVNDLFKTLGIWQ